MIQAPHRPPALGYIKSIIEKVLECCVVELQALCSSTELHSKLPQVSSLLTEGAQDLKLEHALEKRAGDSGGWWTVQALLPLSPHVGWFVLSGVGRTRTQMQVFNLLPIIKYFPGPHQKIYQNGEELKAFFREAVKAHRETLDPDSPRDYIDAYLLEIEKQKSNEDSTFHEENMVMSVADLFMAGTDTTSTTIRWGLIYLTQNPDVQERCHEEIVRVLGYDRMPSMDDRDKLPYINATVHEFQRFGNIVPANLMHETTQPTKLRGYDIPKGTEILTNLTAILTDKDHWKYPDTFNPENFIDDNGHFFKPESFLPFSLGPRVCLGETLAKMELFLFITSLLQRIRFSWPPGVQKPDMNGIFGLVRSPEPYDIICHSRG